MLAAYSAQWPSLPLMLLQIYYEDVRSEFRVHCHHFLVLMGETKFCVTKLSITLRISALYKAEICPFTNHYSWNLFALEHWGCSFSLPLSLLPYIPLLFSHTKTKERKTIIILIYILNYYYITHMEFWLFGVRGRKT